MAAPRIKTLKMSVAVATGAAAVVAVLAAPAGAATVHDDPKAPQTSRSEHAPEASTPQGKIVSSTALNVRSEPDTKSRVVGTLQPGWVVNLGCKVLGERVDGNRIWYMLDDSQHRGEGDELREDERQDDRDRRYGDEDRRGERYGDEDRRHDRYGDEHRPGGDREGDDDGRDHDQSAGWVSARYVKNLNHVPWC